MSRGKGSSESGGEGGGGEGRASEVRGGKQPSKLIKILSVEKPKPADSDKVQWETSCFVVASRRFHLLCTSGERPISNVMLVAFI